MSHQIFTIEETKFELDISRLSDIFAVKSVLGNYQVILDSSESPLKKIHQLLADPSSFLIIDQNILNHFGQSVELDTSRIYAVNATEEAKTLEGVADFFDFLMAKKASKGAKIIVVGGGIVQEIAAFAARCYKRGVDWIFFPTTLLAMCDSCIGGKSSLNYKGVKNQLGLFSSPTEIFINLRFLESLPIGDLKSGMGEILKLCIIGGDKFLEIYESRVRAALAKDLSALKELLLLALAIKRAVIEVDEFDNHERKALNYGHTIGHIIESLTKFQIPHGLAVVAGMIFANHISFALGMLPEKYTQKIDAISFDLLDESIVNKIAQLDPQKIFDLLATDKKAKDKNLQFILLQRPSLINLVKVDLQNQAQIISEIIAQVLQEIFSKRKF